MTATPPTMTARRTYRHPTTGAEHLLIYRATPTGHVVTHYAPAGESVGGMPEVYRLETVEGARVIWLTVTNKLTRAGYRRA